MPSLEETIIEDRNRIQPNHANNLGTAHGGYVLRWMDEVGAMSAMRFSGESCVTAHIHAVDFELPLELGDIALVNGYVYDAGRSSIKVRVRAYGEDPYTGTQELTTASYFVFVAIDEDRNPTSVPELTIESDRGEALREEAISEESAH